MVERMAISASNLPNSVFLNPCLAKGFCNIAQMSHVRVDVIHVATQTNPPGRKMPTNRHSPRTPAPRQATPKKRGVGMQAECHCWLVQQCPSALPHPRAVCITIGSFSDQIQKHTSSTTSHAR